MVKQIGFHRELCTKRLIEQSRRNVRAETLQDLTRLDLVRTHGRLGLIHGPLVRLTHLGRLDLQGNYFSFNASMARIFGAVYDSNIYYRAFDTQSSKSGNVVMVIN